MNIMPIQKKVYKHTLILILIFLLGVIGFVIYINASFDSENEVQTSTIYEISENTNS